jgi:DNA-binding NarL/FixJ family response regulator
MALERDGLEVCAEAASASQAVEAALREHPDACLLDVRMPGGGISAASMITFRLPGTVVLMLTVSRDDDDLFESLRRGASGYLLKDGDPTKVALAVRSALEGAAPLSGELTAQVIEKFRQRPRARRLAKHPEGRPDLTAREWEVLELLVEGVGTADMAKRLFLSQVTVRRHVSNILGKLGVSSRDEAVRLALGEESSAEADAHEGLVAPAEDPAGSEPTVLEHPRQHAVPALTYERSVSKSTTTDHPTPKPTDPTPELTDELSDAQSRASRVLTELRSAIADARSTGDREAARSAELERALADSVAAEKRARKELEQSRRENERLRSRLRAEVDRLSFEADESWSRVSRLVDDLARPEHPELPPPSAPADLDELARTSLSPSERGIAGDTLERLPGLLDAGERVVHLGIGDYDGTVGLLVVTEWRLLMLKPDDAMYQVFPYSEVSGIETQRERFGRGSLHIATRHGDLVLKARRLDVLESLHVRIRERISSSSAQVHAQSQPTT